MPSATLGRRPEAPAGPPDRGLVEGCPLRFDSWPLQQTCSSYATDAACPIWGDARSDASMTGISESPAGGPRASRLIEPPPPPTSTRDSPCLRPISTPPPPTAPPAPTRTRPVRPGRPRPSSCAYVAAVLAVVVTAFVVGADDNGVDAVRRGAGAAVHHLPHDRLHGRSWTREVGQPQRVLRQRLTSRRDPAGMLSTRCPCSSSRGTARLAASRRSGQEVAGPPLVLPVTGSLRHLLLQQPGAGGDHEEVGHGHRKQDGDHARPRAGGDEVETRPDREVAEVVRMRAAVRPATPEPTTATRRRSRPPVTYSAMTVVLPRGVGGWGRRGAG